jgi:hypothetical protein
MDPFKPYQPRRKTASSKLTVVDAEMVALKAVAWIAADDDVLSRFVSLTGCGADELRSRISEPAFLGAILDFMLGDDSLVIAFTEREVMTPETPMLARVKLP